MYVILMFSKQPPNILRIRRVLKVIPLPANPNYWYSLGPESHSDFPKINYRGRSQCPRGLMCGYAAAHLLGLLDRIALKHDVCPLRILSDVQIEVSATGRSLVQGSPTECVYVSLSVVSCNSNTLQLQRVRRKYQKRKERKKKKERKKERICADAQQLL